MRLDTFQENVEFELFDQVGTMLVCQDKRSLGDLVKTPALTIKETIERLKAVNPQELITCGNHVAENYNLGDSEWECLVPNPQTNKIEEIDIERSYKISIQSLNENTIYHYRKAVDLNSLPLNTTALDTTTSETRPRILWKFSATVGGVQRLFVGSFLANKDAIK